MHFLSWCLRLLKLELKLLGNYLQQTTSAEDIFNAFFSLRFKIVKIKIDLTFGFTAPVSFLYRQEIVCTVAFRLFVIPLFTFL